MHGATLNFLLAAAIELPDLRSVPADPVVPAISDDAPSAGKRVRHRLPEYESTRVYHVLYLPPDWTPQHRFPVIVEYAGNGGYSNRYGDVCTGLPEDSKLGYGICGGTGFIWVCLPYIDVGRTNICTRWWGDASATADYCRKAVRMIC
ncbi:MAG: hypothetical protein N3B01_09455 [Verrucomicrobiae bacterium]|nr:hypothetical protein [Verrucomicrobiae bacterium]